MEKKYCPALVCMLRSVCGLRHKEICEATGYTSSAVGNIIMRRGLTDKRHRPDVDISDVERDYLSGLSTYEMAEKYGVYHSTISKWMKKLGHVRGKGSYCAKGSDKGHETQRDNAIKKLADKALCDSGGTIRLVEYVDKYKQTFICNTCGHEFTHGASRHAIRCPFCAETNKEQVKAEKDKQREDARLEREREREREYNKEKVCVSCGAVFHSEYAAQLYCSDTCSRREKRHRAVASGKTKLVSCGNHRKRARDRGVTYEAGITLKKLMERDNNVCQICGEPCDKHDLRWGYSGPFYPSIDHIKPMSKGGSHTWDNVQLAHMICNSNKRDLWEVSA